MIAHARLVLDGRVSPLLLWEKHGIVLAAAALLALMLLLILKRLMFGTRPRVVVQHVSDRRGPRLMHLVTSETVDRPIERGEIVYAVAISGANILRDMREAVVNTIGGHMTKYEALLDKTIARALEACRSAPERRATTACSASASRTPTSPAAPSRWWYRAPASDTPASAALST